MEVETSPREMRRVLETCALVVAITAPAAADTVATSVTAAPPADPPVAPAGETHEPDPDVLAKAPAADQASGVAVEAPRDDHRIANTLLALPRGATLLLLTGPRYGAAELDDYLDSRSPNAYGRDVKQSWRFGATFDWEKELGPSLGLRVGRKLGAFTAVDAYGGLFGARGQSGGIRAVIGRYTAAQLEPAVSLDLGRDMERAFAGIGEPRGPRTQFEERGYTAVASLASHLGPVQIEARGVFDHTRATDADDDPLSKRYDAAMLPGFAEQQRAETGELSVAFDQRHATHPWIRASSPSAGFYARGAAAYTTGEASRTGGFSTWRGTLEARQLFDLFHGDRVLSIGVRGEAVSADADALPFDRLPGLGGRDLMRAFARDELRDRATTYADIDYEWALGGDSRAYLFVETGAAQAALDDVSTSRLHAGYGGGIKVLGGSGTAARFQVAGSDEGDVGFFLQIGAL